MRALLFILLGACSSNTMPPCDRCADPVPQSVTYRDLDPAVNSIRGTLHIQRAADESRVEAYQVSFASDATHKLAPIVKVNKTGADLDVMIPTTKVPSMTTGIVVSAIVAGKESAMGVFVTPADNYPRRTELDSNSAQNPFLLLDPMTDDPIVVATAASSMELPTLFLCKKTMCRASGIAAPPQTGRTPSAVFEGDKLLIVATNLANQNRLSLHACDRDGTNCAIADISANQPADSGFFPRVATDNGKLLTVARNGTTPFMYRCSTTGTGCTARDVSGSGAPIDTTGRLAFVTDSSNAWIVWPSATSVIASRCNLDGTGCKSVDVGAKVGGMLKEPSAVLDSGNGKLLVAARNAGDGDKPYLVRCELDLSSCSGTAMSMESGALPALAIDAVDKKAVAVVSKSDQATLISCGLDGSACVSVPLTPSSHSYAPAGVAIDASAHLYAAWNEDGGKKLVLFDVGLF